MGFYDFMCWVTLVLVLMAPPTKGGGIGGLISPWDAINGSPVDHPENNHNGTRWAVLVAGSFGYDNYRHQADVCHAYQILKRGGLKDENIVVFMYDDIAYNEFNPRKGIIINHPKGHDVYHGVPKDYTGENVTAENFYAVILGNKSAVKGGSRKVVDSKANDRIFIYYADHGNTGLLGMPTNPPIYAKDFVDVLKKKHASRTYKEMVIYVEACESGSMFEHLLPKDLNIYAQTAANTMENSYATYWPDTKTPPPPGFDTCLGDKYSVSWMEDSETHNLKRETIRQQYERVKNKTLKYPGSSHVMQYGTRRNITSEKLYLYLGFINHGTNHLGPEQINLNRPLDVVNQRDTDLVFLWERYKKLEDGTNKKAELLEQIKEKMAHRQHVDGSVDFIGLLLFGPAKARSILNFVGEQGSPLVNDWECLKSMVGVFETHCGPLTRCGWKHMRAFANICNENVSRQQMEKACLLACSKHDFGKSIQANRHFST